MSAIISQCGNYRYRLERTISDSNKVVAGIMINPSTADETIDDHTIRKWIGIAKRNDWGKIIIGNKFAYRSTNVKNLKLVNDPIGPDNDSHLRQIFLDADQIIVAWGPLSKTPSDIRDRWKYINELSIETNKPLYCFGDVTKDGSPRHPLMISYNTTINLWSGY